MADFNLANIDDNKKNIKDTIMNFIVPLIAGILTGALFFLVIYPSFTKTPELRTKLASQQALQNTLKEKLTNINKLVDYKSVVDQDSDLVNRVLPDVDDVPGILDQVDQMAREAGLEVSRLSYSFGETSNPDADGASYKMVMVSLGAEGNHNQVVQFLKNVENAARLVNVTNFRYNAVLGKGSDSLTISMSLMAPFMKVQSTAVTDDALKLDLTSSDFVGFINRLKNLKFYKQLTAEQQSEARKRAQEQSAAEATTEETTQEATPAAN